MNKLKISRGLVAGAIIFLLSVLGGSYLFSLPSKPVQSSISICDGVKIITACEDDNGTKYETYIYHEATAETTREVNHPAEPAKTHTINHPAETATRQVQGACIQTSISYKNGTCALSQCRDGSYSGSTGRGTCSYHGGVARSGGPWYTYTTETYVVKEAWTETIVDVPAKEAWVETIVVPAKEAYTEKVIAR